MVNKLVENERFIKKLFIDMDNTSISTIKRVWELYCEDFKDHPKYKHIHWTDINSWDFKELNCTTKGYINTYFGQARFFKNLEFMDNAKEILIKLIREGYEIYIVTMGSRENLLLKEKWLEEQGLLEYVDFIGCDFSLYKDKSHVDMSGGIFIDDENRYLDTSNAEVKVCFGDVYPWNDDIEYRRLYNWYEIYRFLEYG